MKPKTDTAGGYDLTYLCRIQGDYVNTDGLYSNQQCDYTTAGGTTGVVIRNGQYIVIEEPVPLKRCKFTIKFYVNSGNFDGIKWYSWGFFKKKDEGYEINSSLSLKSDLSFNSFTGSDCIPSSAFIPNQINKVELYFNHTSGQNLSLQIKVNDGSVFNKTKAVQNGSNVYAGFRNNYFGIMNNVGSAWAREFVFIEAQAEYDLVDVPAPTVTRVGCANGIATSVNNRPKTEDYCFNVHTVDEFGNVVTSGMSITASKNAQDYLTFSSNLGGELDTSTAPALPYYYRTRTVNGECQITVKAKSISFPVKFDLQAHSEENYLYNSSPNSEKVSQSFTVPVLVDWGGLEDELFFEPSGKKWNNSQSVRLYGYKENGETDADGNLVKVYLKQVPVQISEKLQYAPNTVSQQVSSDDNGDAKFYLKNLDNHYVNEGGSDVYSDTDTDTVTVSVNTSNTAYASLYHNVTGVESVNLVKQDLIVTPTLYEKDVQGKSLVKYPNELHVSWDYTLDSWLDGLIDLDEYVSFDYNVAEYSSNGQTIISSTYIGNTDSASFTHVPVPPSSGKLGYVLIPVTETYKYFKVGHPRYGYNGGDTVFSEDSSIPTSVISYGRGDTGFRNISHTNAYIGQKAQLSGNLHQLLNGEHYGILGSSGVGYSVDFLDEQGNVVEHVDGGVNTNSEGNFVFKLSSDLGIEARVTLTYHGDVYWNSTSTSPIIVKWRPKNKTVLSISVLDVNHVEKYDFKYKDVIRVRGRLMYINQDNNQEEPASNESISLMVYHDGHSGDPNYESNTFTNSDGYVDFIVPVTGNGALPTLSSNLLKKGREDWYDFRLKFYGSEAHDPAGTEYKTVYYRNPTHFELVEPSSFTALKTRSGNGFSWWAMDFGSFTLRLCDSQNTPLRTKKAYLTYTGFKKYNPSTFNYDKPIPSTDMPEQVYSISSGGSDVGLVKFHGFRPEYACNGVITFTYEYRDDPEYIDPDCDLYEPCSISVPVEFKVVPLEWSATRGYTTESTLEGRFTLTVIDARNPDNKKPIANLKLVPSLTFNVTSQSDTNTVYENYLAPPLDGYGVKTVDGTPSVSSVASLSNYPTGGLQTKLNGDIVPVIETDSSGKAFISYTPNKQGDVVGRFDFSLFYDEAYQPVGVNHKFDGANITWTRIQTQLTTPDLTHYNGRYTNLVIDMPAWNVPSPGTKEDYKSIRTQLSVVNSQTRFKDGVEKLLEKPLTYIYQSNDSSLNGKSLFPTDTSYVTDGEGKVWIRWTRTINNLTTPKEDDVLVQFQNDLLFKPANITFHLKTLPRLKPVVTFFFDCIPEYKCPNRYNIPFNIGLELREPVEGGTGDVMQDQVLELYFNESRSPPPWGSSTLEYETQHGILERIKIDNRIDENDGVTNRTGIDGIYYRYRYRSQVVSKDNSNYPDGIPVVLVFNRNDKIDRYDVTSRVDYCVIDKDTPYFEFDNLPETIRRGCGYERFMVIVSLFNSIGERIFSEENVHWRENLGDSYNGDCWEEPEHEDELTHIYQYEGRTYNFIKARSGIKKVKVYSDETWRYYSNNLTSYLEYKLYETYGDSDDVNKQVVVHDGMGRLDIDPLCQLPYGLYDLKIEYIGPEENGCKKYADTERYYGVHRKHGTNFMYYKGETMYSTEWDNVLEEEIYKQFSATVKLVNEEYYSLEDHVIETDVNDVQPLKQKTGVDGVVTRHHMDTIPGHYNYFHFYYIQTRKNAGCKGEMVGRAIPVKPIFAYLRPLTSTEYLEYFRIPQEDGTFKYYYQRSTRDARDPPNEILRETYERELTLLNYEYNDFSTTIRAYYYTKHYDLNGEEIRKAWYVDRETDVYHSYNDDGDDEYYVYHNRHKTLVDKSLYENGESYHDFNPITQRRMTWWSASGDEVVAETITDGWGFGEIIYHRQTTDIARVTVHIEDSEDIDPDPKMIVNGIPISLSMDLWLDTRPRIKTVITASKVVGAKYNEPCTLNCTIKDEDGYPLAGHIVRFTQGDEDLGETYTDENGYATWPYFPSSPGKFKYHVVHDIHGIYDKSEKIFTVEVERQTPILTATCTPTSVEYGDKIKVTATITESIVPGIVPQPIPNLGIQCFFVSSSCTAPDIAYFDPNSPRYIEHIGVGLTEVPRTDSKGQVTFNVDTKILQRTGDYKLWCFFEGDSREPYNATTNPNEDKFKKRHGFYHAAQAYVNNGSIVKVDPIRVSFQNMGVESFAGFHEGQTRVKLVNNNGEQLPDKHVLGRLLRKNGNTTTVLNQVDLVTNMWGDVGFDFLHNPPTEFTNVYPRQINEITKTSKDAPNKCRNVKQEYLVEYYLNPPSSLAGIPSHAGYEACKQTFKYTFSRARTQLIPYSDEDGYHVKLVNLENNEVIPNATIHFFEKQSGNTTETETISKVTDSNGLVTVVDSEVADGDHRFHIRFYGHTGNVHGDERYNNDDIFFDCEAYGNWVSEDESIHLSDFDIFQDKWYGSQKDTAGYGWKLDNKGNKVRLAKLRNQCDVYKNPSDVKYSSEYGINVPTSILLKSHTIHTTRDCEITFQLMFHTDRSDKGFLGHFGVMQPVNDETGKQGERVPVRFEFYQYPKTYENPPIGNNTYICSYYGVNMDKTWKVDVTANFNSNLKNKNFNFIEFDKWYDMKVVIKGSTFYLVNETVDERTVDYTWRNGDLVGMVPYLKMAMSYCEFRIKSLKFKDNTK